MQIPKDTIKRYDFYFKSPNLHWKTSKPKKKPLIFQNFSKNHQIFEKRNPKIIFACGWPLLKNIGRSILWNWSVKEGGGKNKIYPPPPWKRSQEKQLSTVKFSELSCYTSYLILCILLGIYCFAYLHFQSVFCKFSIVSMRRDYHNSNFFLLFFFLDSLIKQLIKYVWPNFNWNLFL